MSVVMHLNTLSSIFKEIEKANKKIREESKTAKDPELFVAANKKITMEKLKKEVAEVKTAIRKTLWDDYRRVSEKLEEYYETTRGEDRGGHFLRAQRIENSPDLETGLKSYKRNVSRMTGPERDKFRHIYDDGLMELQERLDPHSRYLVDSAIDEFRPTEEKKLVDESRENLQVFQQTGVLEAAIDMEVEAIQEDSAPVNYKWATIMSEIKASAKRSIYGPQLDDSGEKQLRQDMEEGREDKRNPYNEKEAEPTDK